MQDCKSKLSWMVAKIIKDENKIEKERKELTWLEAGKVTMDMGKDDKALTEIAGKSNHYNKTI